MRSVLSPGALLVLAVGGIVVMAGCSSGPPLSNEAIARELARADPVETETLARVRVGFDEPLPDRLVQPLCDEFSLVLVTSERDWQTLRERFELSPLPEGVSLSDGAIVGIIANVGEASGEDWPIRIDGVRVRDGEGLVEARFKGGLYYPLRSPGYLELAYAPTLESVRMVAVGHRRFIIRSDGPSW